MPYKLEKRDNKWCVINSDTGENRGCSDSRKMSIEHLRASYAHEGKKEIEIEALVTKALDDYNSLYPGEKDEEMDTKDYGETYPYAAYYGATSFGELDSIQENQDKAMDINMITNQYGALLSNIISSPMMDDKEKISSVDALGSEYKSRIADRLNASAPANEDKELYEKSLLEKAIDAVRKAIYPEKDEESILIYKEDNGSYSWIARYSNNFRDRDNPPEIISAASHKRFVDRVEKGLEPMPELWLWHIPEWKFGVATWVAYDDSGFAIAGGKVDKEKESIAEWLSKQKNVRVSHGMPPLSIKRDESDPSIIVEHATREISPLPDWAAANTLTGFIVLDEKKEKQEDDMPIPANKRKSLIEQWHINPSLLDALEKSNATDAQKAQAEGVESKEVSTEETKTVETPVTETTATTETKEEVAAEVEEKQEDGKTSETSQDNPITREEIAEAFTSIVAPFVESTNTALQALSAKMSAFEGELKEIQEADNSKIVKKAMATPAASLTAMFAAQSAIGRKETNVDGRDSLAKSKPKETKSEDKEVTTGIPFIDSLLSKPQ